jgi:hypothetical protein
MNFLEFIGAVIIFCIVAVSFIPILLIGVCIFLIAWICGMPIKITNYSTKETFYIQWFKKTNNRNYKK